MTVFVGANSFFEVIGGYNFVDFLSLIDLHLNTASVYNMNSMHRYVLRYASARLAPVPSGTSTATSSLSTMMQVDCRKL